jgi:hypothetical protein
MPINGDSDIENDLVEDVLFCMIETVIRELQEESDSIGKPRRARNAGGIQAAQEYLNNLLNSEHPERIKSALRMSKNTFIALRNWLTKNTLLKASKHVSVDLKIAIFLFITTRPASQRDTMERWPVGNRVVSS